MARRMGRLGWMLIVFTVIIWAGVAVLFLLNRRLTPGEENLAVLNAGSKLTSAAMQSMDSAADAYRNINEAGGQDLDGLNDPAALDRRIELAEQGVRATETVLELLTNAEASFVAELQRDGVEQTRQQTALETFRAGMPWGKLRHTYGIHLRGSKALLNQFLFLREQKGHWRLDAQRRAIVWDSPELEPRATEVARELSEAMAADLALAESPSSHPTQ